MRAVQEWSKDTNLLFKIVKEFRKPADGETFFNINVKLAYTRITHCRGLGVNLHRPIDNEDHNIMFGCW